MLQIIVVLVEALLRATAGGDGLGVLGLVVIDGDGMDVVDRADEVVDRRRGGESFDERRIGGADEFGFEADEDVNFGGVFLLEALGFVEVGFVEGGEGGEGALGVGELYTC